MKLSDFDYELPKELIAQEALPARRDARLLVLDRKTGSIHHRQFCQIVDYLMPGDLLVLNNTKVLPARFFGKKETGGAVEVLLLRFLSSPHVLSGDPIQITDSRFRGNDISSRRGQKWQALLRPSSRVKAGQKIIFQNGSASSAFSARVLDEPAENSGIRHLEFESGIDAHKQMEHLGRIPLPPYIDREDFPIDRELYQTVYAKVPGSVASPTAGLHFDSKLLVEIDRRGIDIAWVTLHVGYGTFQPVAEEDLSRHVMHAEYFDLPEETAEKINMAKTDGRRIVACGTTTVRTLEAASINTLPPEVSPKRGFTNLFIYPPYEFKIVDAIITNFHLPKTTLLMLVAAFCGKDCLDGAYQEAIQNRYRFYSYGDAMLVI